MKSIHNNFKRCFLCHRKSVAKNLFCIIKSSCPASKKSVKDVILYLARINNTELHIGNDESICSECYKLIVEYDDTLIAVFQKQDYLKQLVERAVVHINSDFELECEEDLEELIEFNDVEYYDYANISESEINKAMNEAMGIKTFTKSKEKITYEYKLTKKNFMLEKSRIQQEFLYCNFCAMRFKSKVRLQKHVSQAHKKFSCELCSFSHRNEDYVMLHMNLHKGRKDTQCLFCEKEFTTKISTIRHMEVHFDNKKYQCDKCGICFSQTTVLYNHKLQHEAEEQPLCCEICNQVFKTKRTFRHHMITHREDRPRYSCEICNKTFTEKYTLKVHKRSHGEPPAQSQIVQQSPASIPTNREIQIQRFPQNQTSPTHSGDQRRFSCMICDQQFINKELLNKHMEKEHDVILKSIGLTPFTQLETVSQEPKKNCHICDHTFNLQFDLNAHLDSVHGVVIT